MPAIRKLSFKPWLWTLVFALIFGLALIYLVKMKRANWQGGELSASHIATIRQDIKNTLEKDGPSEGYQQLKKRYGGDPDRLTTTAHTIIHLVGEGLYHHLGFAAVAICDSDFEYACYHGLFDQAFASEGLTALTAFDQACQAKFGDQFYGCQHGIGHGLAEFFGPDNLVTTLTHCQEIQPQILPFGCVGGALMEFNFPLLNEKGLADTSVRSFDSKNPYAPCSDLPREWQSACYFRLVEWWETVLDKDYQLISNLCDQVGQAHLRQDCFFALGATLPVSNHFDVQVAQEACRLVPKDQVNTCFQGASWVSYAYGHRQEAKTLCPEGCENEYLTDEQGNIIRFW